MKVVTFLYDEQIQVGIISDDGKQVVPANKFSSMEDLMENSSFEEMMSIKSLATAAVDLRDVKILAPIPEPKHDIICLGMNYKSHDSEMPDTFANEKIQARAVPVYFAKRVNRSVDPGGYIDGHFDVVKELDYEAELAVIIGKEAKNVDMKHVQDYIFGYTVLNDVSARDVQTAHKQWYFGKSLDTFTPMGPYIVTADEFDFPPALNITCRVNGELRQNSNTSKMIHGIDYIVSELSHGLTLKVGTVIATGTPGGVAMGMKVPRFLKSGDVVECEIEGIGVLKNTIK